MRGECSGLGAVPSESKRRPLDGAFAIGLKPSDAGAAMRTMRGDDLDVA